MKMTHKLDLLMKERHLNKRQLSMQAHIPYTTISSFYDKGTENVKGTFVLWLDYARKNGFSGTDIVTACKELTMNLNIGNIL